ncbi:MAG TPA: serine hydrolase domain-containing protein, partial [Vitreimonas sp.]|nr:serine hydrolase domain-containing protein [Vitreimonas sp.]
MNRRSLLISAGATALAGCATATPVRPAYQHAARIDAAAARAMEAAQSFPGLAIAIYTREGVYARAYGVIDIDTGEAATADTAFYIASTTKPLTSLALAKLHAAGAFDLDATLASYAPDAHFPAAVRADEVTFRHLLTHTHGISNSGIANRVAYTGMHDPATLWRLLGASTAKSDAPLGTYQYTNVGYNIATVLTDRRMGVAWQDLLQRELFAPAGMTRTSGRMSDARDWRLARPHMLDPERGVVRTYLEKTDETMQSAGGLIMSANDALRWLELMCEDGRIGGRQIVPAEVVQATRAPFADTGDDDNGVRVHYGLGWNVTQHLSEPAYYHSGGFSGFRSNISYLPQRGVGVALFANDVSFATPAMDALMYYVYTLSQPSANADGELATALEA